MITKERPTILVPLDGSPEAEAAVTYAQSLLPVDGDIVLLRVVAGADEFETWAVPSTVSDAFSATTEGARQYLESVTGRLLAAMPQVRSEVVVGDPAGEILEFAESEQVDLIVMTTHGRGAGGRAIFGSVADRVARHGTRPTLLMRGLASLQGDVSSALPDRIVVPLDGSTFAEAALPVAAQLAQRLAIPVRLIRIVALDEILNEISRVRDPEPLAIPKDDVYEAARTHCERQADEYLARHAHALRAEGIDVHHEVLDGTPVFALLDDLQPGDLTVMTTHGRGGVRRWLLGSVAEKLVRNAPGPVVIVPAGQVSTAE